MFRYVICGVTLLMAVLPFISGCVDYSAESATESSSSGAGASSASAVSLPSDRDSRKDGALGLIFGMPQIDDRLDAGGGDREDWRYIVVPETGNMSIKLNVDNASAIDGGWSIMDAQGRTLHRQAFDKSQSFYELRDFPVKRGIYYFQTYASAGQSVYTIASEFTATAPEPVVAEAAPERPRSSKPRVKREAAPAAAEPAPEGKKVKGFISLITPKSDGSAEVTIRDVGKGKGVEAGAVGIVEGAGMKLETTSCFATSCRAIVPEAANPKALKQGSTVVFTI